MRICPLLSERKRMMDERTLRAWAEEEGFAKAALCPAQDFEQAHRLVCAQAPLAERRQLRFYPGQDDPQIRSLAVLLFPYLPAAMPQGESLFVDSYYPASHLAYHAAKRLESRLTAAGCFARANVSYPAKEAAVRAGLGRRGKNSLLITPEYGTRVVIILMATDIEVERDGMCHAPAPEGCMGCGRCAAACPSGAIDERGMTHPERCLRNFMMEGNVTPEPLRRKVGMRLLGCDICQRVCPMQPRAGQAAPVGIRLAELVTADERLFSETVKRLGTLIGRNAARPQRVRAQAALLAGNSGHAAHLPVLRDWAQSPFEAVRTHAEWAMERIKFAGGGT